MDYIELGPVPGEESCAQVGASDYQTQSIRECAVYKRMLDRLFPIPEGLPITYVTRTHRHDFGSYRELAIKVGGTGDAFAAVFDFAMTVERNTPANWDAIAQYELAWFERRDAYRAALGAGRLQAAEVPTHYRSEQPPALAVSASFADLLSACPL